MEHATTQQKCLSNVSSNESRNPSPFFSEQNEKQFPVDADPIRMHISHNEDP